MTLHLKFLTPETLCAEGVFKFSALFVKLYLLFNFSNNISVTQVRVYERETELDSTFENKDKSFSNSRLVRIYF